MTFGSFVCRCPFCKKGAIGYLQTDLRRMNEHISKSHGAAPLTREQCDTLPHVFASKRGRSFVEPQDESSEEEGDFRSESSFEVRVGLLKSSIIFQNGETVSGMDLDPFFNKNDDGINPYLKGVTELFERAAMLCSRAGANMVRQQAQRNCDGTVTAKVFVPVTKTSCGRYAKRVAHFVYFCSKITPGSRMKDATEIMLAVLFERNRTISQTFVARLEVLFEMKGCLRCDMLHELFNVVCYISLT